jgi:hypothetical protein
MSRTATMPIQTVPDCRWSHSGYRLRGFPDTSQPEPLWVCVRTGSPRPVEEKVCGDCPHWERAERHDRQ